MDKHEKLLQFVDEAIEDLDNHACGVSASGLVQVRQALQPLPDKWLIWSNEHAAWWRPASCGYTHSIEDAGRYTLKEAKAICQSGMMRNEFGRSVPKEILTPAPELEPTFAAFPEVPKCSTCEREQVELREQCDGGGYVDPTIVCETCFTPQDTGPTFDDLPLVRPAQEPNIPESRNLMRVKRVGDMSVELIFASCRAASEFYRVAKRA